MSVVETISWPASGFPDSRSAYSGLASARAMPTAAGRATRVPTVSRCQWQRFRRVLHTAGHEQQQATAQEGEPDSPVSGDGLPQARSLRSKSVIGQSVPPTGEQTAEARTPFIQEGGHHGHDRHCQHTDGAMGHWQQ